MSNKLTEHYYNKLKEAWAPWSNTSEADGEFVVPLCTPVIEQADVLVIGISHSRFDGKKKTAWQTEPDRIAERYAEQPPTINTFVHHEHGFAKSMRELIGEATNLIFEAKDSRTKSVFGNWVGTNRCAIQFHDPSQDMVKDKWITDSIFENCQYESDEIIRDLVTQTEPKFVFLMGGIAVALFHQAFYPASINAETIVADEPPSTFNFSSSKTEKSKLKRQYEEIVITDLQTSQQFARSTLIPFFHLAAQGNYGPQNLKRLKANRVSEILEWPSF